MAQKDGGSSSHQSSGHAPASKVMPLMSNVLAATRRAASEFGQQRPYRKIANSGRSMALLTRSGHSSVDFLAASSGRVTGQAGDSTEPW